MSAPDSSTSPLEQGEGGLNTGASFGPGSHASHEAPEGLRPSGFDPSRECEHDFAAWRDFEDGLGGELFCTRCGLGAMAHTLSMDF